MATSSLFTSNRSQAVRLPKKLAFPDGTKTVVVRRVGHEVIIAPASTSWDDFFDAPGIDLGVRETAQTSAREEF